MDHGSWVISNLGFNPYTKSCIYPSVHMSQQVQVAAKKQVAVLENRLDQALKRFNSILADNKKKRELIDHLRQEKVIFENLFKKLEKVTLICLKWMVLYLR